MASTKTKAATAVQDSESIHISAEKTGSSQLTASPKPKGKFKETVTVVSTILPIAGAVGTVGVWLAANFYVGDIHIIPDRPFNTLEVRVSDKKGMESVFHSPHFQLMPGHYHLEVTVDSQYKQHVDVKSVFHHHSNIAVHLPTTANVSSAPGTVGAVVTTSNGLSQLVPSEPAKQAEGIKTRRGHQEGQEQLKPAVSTEDAAIASEQADVDAQDSKNATPTKKRWWQIWKKNQPQD